MTTAALRSVLVCFATTALACRAHTPQIGETAPAPAPDLPPIAAATIVTPEVARAEAQPVADPLATLSGSRLISLHATNADARALLVAVAREAGLNLVVDGDVRARVTVSLTDVPAADAIRAIIESAGLAVAGPSMTGAITSIVFYQLPVNIDRASATTIAARFGTTIELANFIVESRPCPRARPETSQAPIIGCLP